MFEQRRIALTFIDMTRKKHSRYKPVAQPKHTIPFVVIGMSLVYALHHFLWPYDVEKTSVSPQTRQESAMAETGHKTKVTEQMPQVNMPPHILTQTIEVASREPKKLNIPKFIDDKVMSRTAEKHSVSSALWKANAVKANIPEGKARVVVIIDDVGMNYSAAKELAAMKAPLTLAFLPYAPHVDALAAAAKENGHELMIHMPMEPMNPDIDTGPIVLRVDDSPAEFDKMLDKAMSSFTGYVGLNNHMGSRLTQDEAAMRHLMKRLNKRGMLFVDSRTIAGSVAEKTAKEYGVPNAARDVFLDDDPSIEAVRKSLKKGERIASKYGTVIMIGHPKKNTIAALKEWLPTLAEKDMVLVPVTNVIEEPGKTPTSANPSAHYADNSNQ